MLIVGLGNFGKEFNLTYHNVGFMAVDYLSSKLGIKLSKKNCEAKFFEGLIEDKKNIIAQPLTYMNLSGNAVLKLSNKFKIEHSQILIIYDDIDLPVGQVRFREKGSGGTHNGMKNIVAQLGEDVLRIRIGIGKNSRMDLADYVLSKMSIENKEIIKNSIKKVGDSIIEFLKTGNRQILEDLNK